MRAGEAGFGHRHARPSRSRCGLFLTLPAALALIVCAHPIMLVLFGRGAFDLKTCCCRPTLAAYALGLPAFVLVKVLAPAFFAVAIPACRSRSGLVAWS